MKTVKTRQARNGRFRSSIKNILFFFVFANIYFWADGKRIRAEEGKYVFSTAFSTGFLYGQAEEIVYKDTEYHYKSQLLWDMKPVFYWGISLNFEKTRPLESAGFFTNLAVKFGIDGGSGVMEDRDWQDKRDMRLTNYSRHDNYTRNALIFDFQIGGTLPLFKRIIFQYYGFLTLMDFSFQGFNGYYQYAAGSNGIYEEWDESIAKKPVTGNVIDYKQTWALAGAGIAVRLPVDFFSLGVSFALTPFIFCAGRDTHILRKRQFNDYGYGGFFLKPSADISFSFGKLSLSLSFSWRFLNWLISDCYIYDYAEKSDALFFYEKATNSTGSGFSLIDAGLSFAWRF
jgi:outer membrane protease